MIDKYERNIIITKKWSQELQEKLKSSEITIQEQEDSIQFLEEENERISVWKNNILEILNEFFPLQSGEKRKKIFEEVLKIIEETKRRSVEDDRGN